MNFNIRFVDVNPEVYEEFQKQFGHLPNIEGIHLGPFEDMKEYDCMVSPANSFGMMDGGIDAAITRFFGKELQESVQQVIISKYYGEQPVGTSFIVPTNHPEHPYLAHTPTMRVPQNIQGTLNVFYAMKALLEAVQQFNESQNSDIRTVLCPGMGTLVGQLEPSVAVAQMALAYELFLHPPSAIHVPYIYERVRTLKTVL